MNTQLKPIDQWLDAYRGALGELSSTVLCMGDPVFSVDLDELPSDRRGAYISVVGQEAMMELGLATDGPGCRKLTKALLGMTDDEPEPADADVADAVGEIINVLAGGIKTRMSQLDPALKLGLPLFIEGRILRGTSLEQRIAEAKLGDVTVQLVVLRADA